MVVSQHHVFFVFDCELADDGQFGKTLSPGTMLKMQLARDTIEYMMGCQMRREIEGRAFGFIKRTTVEGRLRRCLATFGQMVAREKGDLQVRRIFEEEI